MMPIHPLPTSHPIRPLISWAVQLLQIRPDDRTDAIHDRLAALVPALEPIDLKAAAALLMAGEDLFDLARVIARIVESARLDEYDPAFPWDRIDLPCDQPFTTSDLPWQMREQMRFFLGTYMAVPWADELKPVEDHYVHLSSVKPGLVAYTQDVAKGEADKQTQIRPGRYLTRFYPDLTAYDVRRLVGDVPRPATLAFARTADEIEKIYLDGPSSCMSQPASHYDSPVHPVRVYGDSDLQLAYAVPPDGSPTARALVWTENKIHGRIYGDEPLLTRLLDEAGYRNGRLTGARIRRIAADEDDDLSVVMPYIDGCRSFDILDDVWLEINGPYAASNTNGLGYLEERPICDHCEERTDELLDVGSNQWCEGCRDCDAFCSDYSDRYFDQSEQCEVIIEREDRESVTGYWAECERDDYATFCDRTQEYYQTSRFSFIERDSGETWVAWYLEENPEPEDERLLSPTVDAETDNAATEDRVAA